MWSAMQVQPDRRIKVMIVHIYFQVQNCWQARLKLWGLAELVNSAAVAGWTGRTRLPFLQESQDTPTKMYQTRVDLYIRLKQIQFIPYNRMY